MAETTVHVDRLDADLDGHRQEYSWRCHWVSDPRVGILYTASLRCHAPFL